MIFKRRRKQSTWERIRDFIAPRKGWKRGFRYIGKRVQRLPDTPHRIALGFACGAFVSFSPFFTLHLFAAMLVAWIVRGNLLAGAFGTIVGNPISFPFIATASLQMGAWLMGGDLGSELKVLLGDPVGYVFANPRRFLEEMFAPYLIGGLAPGLICGAAFYYVLRPLVARFQQRRRDSLAEKSRRIVAERRAASAAQRETAELEKTKLR